MNLQEAADGFHSLSHAHQAESAIRHAVDVKSLPIVGDHELQARGRPRQLDGDMACVAMLDGVPQRFLRDSEEAQGDVLIDDRRHVVMGEGHREVRGWQLAPQAVEGGDESDQLQP